MDTLNSITKTKPTRCCAYCDKTFVKKTAYDNHVSLCSLVNGSKKYTVSDDELTVPSQLKMYQMLLALGGRFSKLEEKVDDISRNFNKTKKKINVIMLLNSNFKPEFTFNKLTEHFVLDQDIINCLFERPFHEVITLIFSKHIYGLTDEDAYKYPILAFTQRNSTFYIYENDEIKWTELTPDGLYKFLNKVHSKIWTYFIQYKRSSEIVSKIKESDGAFQDIIDKVDKKIVDTVFSDPRLVGKIKTSMYSNMKRNINEHEYEFEF